MCRLIRYILDNILDTAEEYTPQRPGDLLPREPISRRLARLHDDYHLTEAIKLVSDLTPLLFLEVVMPWIERVVTLSSYREPQPDRFPHDVLAHGWYVGVVGFEENFVKAVADALQAISETGPDSFGTHIRRLADLAYMTCQRLVAIAYTKAGERYSREGLEFLLADSRRFRLGDYDEYDTQKLIEALCPHLTPQENAGLESAILSYQPQIELNARDQIGFRERTHLRLLRAMSINYLTPAGRKRLQELERKYGEYRVPEHGVSMEIGEVKSPIPAEVIPRLRNVHWMSAIAKYRREVEHPDLLKGGAGQLSKDLEGWAKQHPVRAHELAMELPLDTDARHVGAVAVGLSESDGSLDHLCDVVRRFQHRSEREFRLEAARALLRHSADGLPDDVLDLLEGWTREPAQGDEGWWHEEPADESDDPGGLVGPGDPYFGYRNSVRGVAQQALLLALHSSSLPTHRTREWSLLEWVQREGSGILRAGALMHLPYLLTVDEERVLTLFERLLAGNPEFLRSVAAHQFIYYALRKHFEIVAQHIEPLLRSPHPKQRRVGARLACLSGFTHSNAERLVETALAGDVSQRLGAAEVYSANLWQPDVRLQCQDGLRRLMNDPESKVRWVVGTCFGKLGDEDFESIKAFIEDFARSRSFFAYPTGCIEYVYDRATWDPIWAMELVRLVLKNPHDGEEKSWGTYVDLLIRLVLRIYERSTDDTQAEALGLFSSLVERFPIQAQTVVAEHERR